MCWGLGFEHIFLGDTIQPVTVGFCSTALFNSHDFFLPCFFTKIPVLLSQEISSVELIIEWNFKTCYHQSTRTILVNKNQ